MNEIEAREIVEKALGTPDHKAEAWIALVRRHAGTVDRTICYDKSEAHAWRDIARIFEAMFILSRSSGSIVLEREAVR